MTNKKTVHFTKRSRVTGNRQTMARVEELDLDPGPEGGRWATLCEEHGTHAISATLALACKATGLDFCDGCREDAGKRMRGGSQPEAIATGKKK